MPSLLELRQTAADKLATLKQMRDRFAERKAAGKTGADLWPDDSRAKWDQANTDYDAAIAALEDEKRSDEVEARIAAAEKRAAGDTTPPHRDAKPGQDDFDLPAAGAVDAEGKRFTSGAELQETRDTALQAWAGHSRPSCRSERHSNAARRFGIDPSRNELVIDLLDSRRYRSLQDECGRRHHSQVDARALSGTTGTAGGFTVGQTLVTALEVNMLAVGGLLQAADTITTDTGEEMSWPTADDTTHEGEMLGESQEGATTEDPTFAAIKWFAYVFSSKIVKVPTTLLDDSAFNLAQYLGAILGERVGRSLNRKCTTGTGNNQPKGVVTAATLGRTTAAAGAITADDIFRLEHSVDPAYRNPSCAYMMHDSIVLEVRLLKNGTGSYIWRDGLMDNRPDTLNGRRLVLNQHMDSALSASNKTMLFGDFSRYKIRRVKQLVLRRLTERYAEFNQEGFVALLRADGNLLDAGTAPIKYMQQHA